MTKPENIFEAYWNSMQDLINSESSEIDFEMFSSVSERFLKEYKLLQDSGVPRQTIALAMLGATLNMYTLLGSHQRLPGALRDLADILDRDGQVH